MVEMVPLEYAKQQSESGSITCAGLTLYVVLFITHFAV